MPGYESFNLGIATFPLPLSGGIGGTGNTSLRDADPTLFVLIDFARWCLDTYLGERFAEECAAGGIKVKAGAGEALVSSTVTGVMPLNPQPFLTSGQHRLPLLAVYRTTEDLSKARTVNLRVRAQSRVQLDWVLPPVDVVQAVRMVPLLTAARAILHKKLDDGWAPGYTPPISGAAAGDPVWTSVGLEMVDVISSAQGLWEPGDGLPFPALSMVLDVYELADLATGFEDLDVHAAIDLETEEGTVTDVVVIEPDMT